jgi:hypothetical protein
MSVEVSTLVLAELLEWLAQRDLLHEAIRDLKERGSRISDLAEDTCSEAPHN